MARKTIYICDHCRRESEHESSLVGVEMKAHQVYGEPLMMSAELCRPCYAVVERAMSGPEAA